MFARVVEDIAERHIAPAATKIDQSGQVEPSTLRLLAENELLVAGLPAAAGGGDGGDLAAVLLVERLAWASAAIAAIAANSHVCGLMAPPLTPRLAESQDIAVARSARGELGLLEAGSATVLRGRAARVEAPGSASTLIVVADYAGEPIVLLVPSDGAGVQWSEPSRRTGLRGIVTRSIEFDDVRVRSETNIGGAEIANAGLRLELLLGAALCCGIGRAAVEQATHYLRDRRQFGRRLSEFASLRATVSKMAVDVAGAAALTFEAANRAGAVAAASAATAAAATAVSVAIDAVQLHGGYGWTTEYSVERLMRDAASARARLGGSRATVETIVAELLPAG
jgi:alkylation response protein AidB-like acyl-CoA dehydrogenase